MATPPVVVIETWPADAPVGTVTVSRPGEYAENAVVVAPILTSMTPIKLAPITVTTVPTGPEAGEKELMDGGRSTLKAPGLPPVPAGVTTLMRPSTAPLGTTAEICPSEITVKAA